MHTRQSLIDRNCIYIYFSHIRLYTVCCYYLFGCVELFGRAAIHMLKLIIVCIMANNSIMDNVLKIKFFCSAVI